MTVPLLLTVVRPPLLIFLIILWFVLLEKLFMMQKPRVMRNRSSCRRLILLMRVRLLPQGKSIRLTTITVREPLGRATIVLVVLPLLFRRTWAQNRMNRVVSRLFQRTLLPIL